MNSAGQIGLSLSNLRLRKKLQELSIRDTLTGLYNRRFMEETIEKEMAYSRRHKASFGIMMLDIDHFKQFNDKYGHDAGDALLKEVGVLFQNNSRGSDTACRFGGEEFIIILSQASLDITRQRAENLREIAEKLQVLYREKLLDKITFSIGVAIYPDNGQTISAIIKAADNALYRAKKEGRNRVCVADSISS